ncbi:MAG: YbaB/EbfC family nucleoid-associated protein [Micromonosporaceae bacterium]
MNAEVEEWIAANHATFDRIHQTLARANQKARRVTVAVESPDGGVTVEVGADRLVRAVTIDEKAYGGYDERQLAALIVDACRHAKKRVTQAQWHVIDHEFGVLDPGR